MRVGTLGVGAVAGGGVGRHDAKEEGGSIVCVGD